MIGLSEVIPSTFKFSEAKYKLIPIETRTYFGKTKIIYYIESQFCKIGPFDSKDEAMYWKINLEKEPV